MSARPSTRFAFGPCLDSPRTYALLDASRDPEASGWSRLLVDLDQTIVCSTADDVGPSFAAIERCLASGLHVLGLFDYEFGYALQPRLAPLRRGSRALFRALAFRRCERVDGAQIDAWLDERTAGLERPSGIANVRAAIARSRYLADVERIQQYIVDGDCYQANYTFGLDFEHYGDPVDLYRRIRERQRVSYGALIRLGDETILSFSPELFLRRDGETLTTKPMKGTLRRGTDALEDVYLGESLFEDDKNRAENVMIVDLLRNDLGRVATIGSVRVDRLFEVERYRTLLQMTSTISAQLRPNTSLLPIFEALFPCGSVTGAPKVRSMEIIAELESAPRGLYTGALGFIESGGDFCFNVPIRTLVLDPRGNGHLGIGSGIVHDSRPQDEYDECLLKAAFITSLDPGFELIESMYCDREGFRHLDLHLARLEASARYFGFRFDRDAIVHSLAAHRAGLPDGDAFKTRLTLAKEGRVDIASSALEPSAKPPPQYVTLSQTRTDSHDKLLRHKTTARALYDRELARAQREGLFDVLFFNERGELTEGARSNVFVEIEGSWHTPPIDCGLLPGVMRQQVLADRRYRASERTLNADDLARATAIMLTNAVRGTMRVSVVAAQKPRADGTAASAFAEART